MKVELIYESDGKISGLHQEWSFDDMFSSFAVQGLGSGMASDFTREELAPLAKENIESLKEQGYFISVTADGMKVPLADPSPNYSFAFKDHVLSLDFTLPLRTPVKAKQLRVDIYDPVGFVALAFDKEAPVRLINAPNCKLNYEMPHGMTFPDGKPLSQMPTHSKVMNWGAQFGNKILVNCP